ncbi:MAG: mycofactocin precursor MftA [Acidimicrobiaceae bacterium]|nr:mycofactocin precursor MftA [Acidimicrobiaceae bacterium]MDE0605686.1 mycofactocin precursor MftA [Acidimicrobiaceae bacterium]
MEPTNTTAPTGTETESDVHSELVEEELLVEEISIDGMCGVY